MDDLRLSLVGHLEELRQRIIYSAIAILLLTTVAFFFSSQILNILVLPSGGLQLNAFNLMDGFLIKWRIALYTGIILSSPVWIYQVARFVAPGMTKEERQAIFPLSGLALVLFIIGAVFGYYLLWGMIRVLIQFFPKGVDLLPSADDYISFVIFFIVSCSLAFQLPVLIVILVRLRVLNTTILRKQRKIAYFALFAFAEIVTPVSDPIVAPLTIMVPLLLLYEASIWISARIEGSRKPVPDSAVSS
jgi:sec-independent protein translocase protein TatC